MPFPIYLNKRSLAFTEQYYFLFLFCWWKATTSKNQEMSEDGGDGWACRAWTHLMSCVWGYFNAFKRICVLDLFGWQPRHAATFAVLNRLETLLNCAAVYLTSAKGPVCRPPGTINEAKGNDSLQTIKAFHTLSSICPCMVQQQPAEDVHVCKNRPKNWPSLSVNSHILRNSIFLPSGFSSRRLCLGRRLTSVMLRLF